MTPLLLKPAEDDTDVVSAQNHILLIYCPALSSWVSWCLCRISARPLCVTLMMFSSLSAEEAPGWRSLPALSVRWISLLHDPGPREPLQPLPRQRSSHTQRQDGKTTFSHAPCSLMHSKVSEHLNKMYNPENRSVAEGQTSQLWARLLALQSCWLFVLWSSTGVAEQKFMRRWRHVD